MSNGGISRDTNKGQAIFAKEEVVEGAAADTLIEVTGMNARSEVVSVLGFGVPAESPPASGVNITSFTGEVQNETGGFKLATDTSGMTLVVRFA